MILLPVDDQCEPPNLFDAIAIDGAAVVHLLPTANVNAFDEYAYSVFLPHLIKQLEKCVHLDVVWDVYIADNIKASTKEKRGQGIRRKVAGKNKYQPTGKFSCETKGISKNSLSFSPLNRIIGLP